jgi:NADH-quinone oxidoreductase subunit E
MYLLSQIWMFMALAGIVGFVAGWWFGRCRCNEEGLIAERDKAREQVLRLESELTARMSSRMEAASAAMPTVQAPTSGTSFGAPAVLADFATPLAATPLVSTPAAAARDSAKAFSNIMFTPSPLASLAPNELEVEVLAAGAGIKPVGLAAPGEGGPDDLKEIGGVGPTNEAWLHEQGIFHFWQIASLDASGVAWLANNLPTFGKRVYRENWLDQSVRLARGEITDAKRKYEEGKHS